MTNSLTNASSAYLRSAMHQPVRWHEWGEEAFALAQRENKPILLDIGAVWCHWCHVMDRESYESPEVAEIINEHYIAVKVDRDERPDVDSRYQAAVSAMTGQGGWPLTAFLTGDGKPFYGGTYFPPVENFGRPSFSRVLLTIANAYREKRDEVVRQGEIVLTTINNAEGFAGKAADSVPAGIVESMAQTAKQLFDSVHGGFGSAPKFPHPSALDLLTHAYARSGDAELRQVITLTLERMARGGVYDQLAGGFHRYSVDERWVVPHFEKMAYDNSELLKNYVHAYQATGNPFFAAVARDIIRWMDAWLSDREKGGFYSSQDADYSLEDDGDYFTWTLAEAREVLAEEELRVASLYYDIGEAGEMHHNPAKNVLFVRTSVEDIAVRLGMQPERVAALLDSAKAKMYTARLRRPTPYVDKTVYVNWNALCISAYLQAAKVFSDDDTRHFALRSLDRILAEAWDPDRGMRHVIAYSDPKASGRTVPGMLDDYAFTVAACLDAYEVTDDMSYFNFGRRIADAMLERFYDATGGGFFDTEPPMEGDANATLGALRTRRKPFQDSPTPAANSVAAIVLLRLHSLTNEGSYHDKAEQTLEIFAGSAQQYGIYAATYGIAAVWLLHGYSQVVVIGNDEQADQLYAAAVAPFAANKMVLRVRDNEVTPHSLPPALAVTIPALASTTRGQSVAVLCANFTCMPPIGDPDELSKTLAGKR
ncbi:MAG: thioredoxin domain-containing protein [Candidatus Korobacteraceae bacterium]